MNFYWFDVFILGLTLLLGLKGILNGLVKEFFGLLGIVGGVFLGAKYSSQVALFIGNTFYKIENQSLAEFVGFLAVLIIFWLFCLLFGNVFSKLIKLSGLGFLDRIGGFLFGAAKIFLIFAILIFCVARIGFLNDKLESFAKGSYTLEILKKTGAYIMNQPLAQNNLNETTKTLQNLQKDLNNAQGE